jgi:hypothetical protein
LDVGDIICDGDHFQSEFVAGSSGVCEKGKFPEMAGDVGAADSHAVGADERLAGGGSVRFWEIDEMDFSRGGELDCLHQLFSARPSR